MAVAIDPVIFREYDIRGIVGQHIDAEFAEVLGKAYTTFVIRQRGIKGPTFTIGHDARLSSPELVAGLARGMTSSGANVIHLGLVTTPMTYFTTFALEGVDGAIMITGSHNPPEYNGFKISVGKSTIFGSEIQELYKIIKKGDFERGQGTEDRRDIKEQYVARYKEEFGQLNDVPLVVDCGNGAAGCIARQLYEAVGLKPTILFEEPDGTFPNHHPDPTVAENLVDLIAAVKEKGAKVGLGFDGDADRIGVVDHKGNIIMGDEIIALCSRSILAKQKGQKIIGDVKCSDRLYNDVAKHGGVPIMWKTGHSLIKQKIKDEKAPFGGELSGHIFFADRNYGYDDALYAGLRVMEILSQTGQTIDQLLSDLPPSFNTPEIRIDTTEEKKHTIVTHLKEVFAKDTDEYKVNFTDGVRVSFEHGWALARASNTQPVLVLRFEADSQPALDDIRGRFETLIQPLL